MTKVLGDPTGLLLMNCIDDISHRAVVLGRLSLTGTSIRDESPRWFSSEENQLSDVCLFVLVVTSDIFHAHRSSM